MTNNKEDLAWLAGFTDGDGYFGCSKYSNGGALSYVISQNGESELLYRAQKILGFGNVNGPYFVKGRKPNYRFVVNGFERVQATIAALWPWLGTPKRNQAEKVLKTIKEIYK